MSKRARGILIAVAVLVAVPLATSTVHAQPPFPSDYRGTVFVAGEPAGAGLEVTAQILDWTTDEAAPTDESGEYWLGIAPTEGHYAGETIYFYVDGTLADETALFVAGESVDNFDLHVAAIAPPSPTPTATATPVPTETPGATPTVTPTPGATPTTTPTPTTSVTPTAMPTPSAAPTATPTPTPTPTAASPDTTDGFGIGMIIGIAAGALALGGLIMWLIMRRGRGQPPQPPSPGSRGQRPPRSGGERPAQREPG